jgi:hypothetical protein
VSTRFIDHLLAGTIASRPAATAVPVGTLYSATDEGRVYQSDGTNWGTWATATTAGGAGRVVEIKVVDDQTVVTTGDGKAIFCVPAALNGCNLTSAHAFVTTVSSSGLPTVQIRNVTDTVDMLTTRITIDATETTSYTAAAPAVIDTAHDDVATGDLIAVDVDVAGTGTKGLGVILTFALP